MALLKPSCLRPLSPQSQLKIRQVQATRSPAPEPEGAPSPPIDKEITATHKILMPLKNLPKNLRLRVQRMKPSERKIRQAAREFSRIEPTFPDAEALIRAGKHLSQVTKLMGVAPQLELKNRPDLAHDIRMNANGKSISIRWYCTSDRRPQIRVTTPIEVRYKGDKIRVTTPPIAIAPKLLEDFSKLTGCEPPKAKLLLAACQASYDQNRLERGQEQWRDRKNKNQDTSITGHGDRLTLHLNYGDRINTWMKRIKRAVTVQFKNGKIDSLEPALVYVEHKPLGNSIDRESRRALARELKAMEMLAGSKNCLPLIGHIENPPVNNSIKPRLIVPKFDGDLEDLIIKNPSGLNNSDRISIISQALNGLAEIHRAGIVHNDIKPTNIFARKVGNGYHAVIGDFGLCVFGDDPCIRDSTSGYIAPEKLDSPPLLDAKSDVFSMGVTLFELRKGEQPKFSSSMEMSRRSRLAQEVSDELRSGDDLDKLIGDMFRPHAERPSLDEVIARFRAFARTAD